MVHVPVSRCDHVLNSSIIADKIFVRIQQSMDPNQNSNLWGAAVPQSHVFIPIAISVIQVGGDGMRASTSS